LINYGRPAVPTAYRLSRLSPDCPSERVRRRPHSACRPAHRHRIPAGSGQPAESVGGHLDDQRMTKFDEQLRPTWSVQAVFEPGTARAFAYTIGLQDLGLPELHMLSHPTVGSDRGRNWHLSTRDLGYLLNRFGSQLMLGEIGVGQEIDLSMDDGATTVRCTFGTPVPGSALEALGARDAPVIPIRWSLHRTPRSMTCSCDKPSTSRPRPRARRRPRRRKR
jgi:hypothetical protein